MGANDGITGVGVGLGHKPHPKDLAVNGTGGTAVVHYDPRDFASLLKLRGRTVREWAAIFPASTSVQAAPYSKTQVQGGVTSLNFSNAHVVEVRHIGGAVEVTLQYGAAQRIKTGGTPAPVFMRAVSTKGVSGNRTGGNNTLEPAAARAAFSTSKSGIKT